MFRDAKILPCMDLRKISPNLAKWSWTKTLPLACANRCFAMRRYFLAWTCARSARTLQNGAGRKRCRLRVQIDVSRCEDTSLHGLAQDQPEPCKMELDENVAACVCKSMFRDAKILPCMDLRKISPN